MTLPCLDRRSLLRGGGIAGAALLAGSPLPTWAASRAGQDVLSGEAITLRIGKGAFPINGRMAPAVTINGTCLLYTSRCV